MIAPRSKIETSIAGEIPLNDFRRRIRVLRAWRLGAMCGIAGAVIATVVALLDMMAVIFIDPWMLVAITGLGVLVGISRAITEPLPYEAVAGSVDRRAGLADRVLTAREIGDKEVGWSSAVHDDAAAHLSGIKPGSLYPMRFGRWQGAFLAVALLGPLIWFGANTSLFRSAQQRKDAADLKAAAQLVQQVIKPQLEAANTSNATKEDKDLAKELQKFAQAMDKGRMTKAEALIKANQLAEQAQRLEDKRSNDLNETIQKTQTAQQALQQKAGLDSEKMQSMSPEDQQKAMSDQERKLSDQESSVQKQMDAIQKALDNNKSLDGKSPLDQKMSDALKKQLAELQKMMQSIKLSKQALDFLNKLSQQADFQKAMKDLEKLAENQQKQGAGEQPTMTKEQMEAAAKEMEAEAKELEKMAKQFDSDGKIAELAKEMEEAAKQAKMGNQPGVGPALMAAMGMGPPMGSMPIPGGPHQNGPSGPGSPFDTWRGYTNKPPMSSKSSLLNAKYQDRTITSEIGDKGDQTYVEVTGPTMATGKTSVPYQTVLPKYEKTAETALDRSDIPPSERAKVRTYFDSLRNNGQ